MTVPENDIAALFDPKLDDPVPVIPPGTLPPSWAAVQPRAPQPVRAWSEAEPAHGPDGSAYDHGEDDTAGLTSLQPIRSTSRTKCWAVGVAAQARNVRSRPLIGTRPQRRNAPTANEKRYA
ncbi:hypothetical protein GCM10020255_012060 [Rhodococcus baikonurensis]